MILYVLRHGHTVSHSVPGPDEERPLSQEGRQKVSHILSAASGLGFKADRIISSPYRRALETAEMAKEALKVSLAIAETECLEPDSAPYELYSYLAKQDFGPDEGVLMVSHQPLVSGLLSDLLGFEANISFPPASMARIDLSVEPSTRAGTLVWAISSNVL